MSHQIIRPRVAELGGDVSVVVLRQAQEEVVVVFDDGHWTTSSAPGSRARLGVLTTIVTGGVAGGCDRGFCWGCGWVVWLGCVAGGVWQGCVWPGMCGGGVCGGGCGWGCGWGG